jgi:uncharacterized protein
MQWLNEPAGWQRTNDVLRVTVDPGTDFWRATGYGYIHDNGHVYGEVLPGDLDVSVRLRGTFAHQYDQAGLMLRADERTWLKTGVEFFEGRPRLSTVLTLGWSSWMVADLPADLDEITLRMSRRGEAVEIRYAAGEEPAELAALVFMPPDREMLAGIMCAAPEGSGFIVSFYDLRVAGRDWGAGPAAAEAAAGWDGEPEGSAAPAWDGQPEAGPDHAWGEPSGGGSADWREPRPRSASGWPDCPPEGRPAEWADERSGDPVLDWAQPQASDAVADWDRLSGSLAAARGTDPVDKQPQPGRKKRPGGEPGSKRPGGSQPGSNGPAGTGTGSQGEGSEPVGQEPAGEESAGGEPGGKRPGGSGQAAAPALSLPDDQTDPVLPAATEDKLVPAARKRGTPKPPGARIPGGAGSAEPVDAADEWISLLTAADPGDE